MQTKDVVYKLWYCIACCGLILSTQVGAVEQSQGAVPGPELHAQVVMPNSQETLLYPGQGNATVRTSSPVHGDDVVDQSKSADGSIGWNVTLRRHGAAIAFELLLIGCLVVLRIHEKKTQRETDKASTETA
jgi:hypothetical protein